MDDRIVKKALPREAFFGKVQRDALAELPRRFGVRDISDVERLPEPVREQFSRAYVRALDVALTGFEIS